MTTLCRRLRRCFAALLAVVAAGPSFADGSFIRGAGATFPAPLYARWAEAYRQATGIDVVFAPVGSAAGVEQIERGLVDFGASDVPLAPAELRRAGLMQFPSVVGGVVPVVNLAGINAADLKLTGELLGDIYLGKVRKWNDRAIVALNPGLSLPNANITVVHRADASGTTFLWSEFLSRSNPEWKARVGSAEVLPWPVGVADTGNGGVASTVQRTRASIGYMEYAFAQQHRLGATSLRNKDGQFVRPSRASFEAAALASGWSASGDLDRQLVDPGGEASWPLAAATYIVLPARPREPERTREVMRFFGWALRHGQRAAMDLDYVPLPDSAVELIEKRWAEQATTPAGGAVREPGVRR